MIACKCSRCLKHKASRSRLCPFLFQDKYKDTELVKIQDTDHDKWIRVKTQSV